MPLTRDFRETIQERAQDDPEFRRGLLTEGIALMLTGDNEDRMVGKAFLRDYINATIGFQRLSKELDCKPQSLMRMFSSKGNPRLSSLSAVVQKLQSHEGVHLQIGAK